MILCVEDDASPQSASSGTGHQSRPVCGSEGFPGVDGSDGLPGVRLFVMTKVGPSRLTRTV